MSRSIVLNRHKQMITIITYKLNNPDKDYMPFYGAIKSHASDWWHSFDAFWLIRTETDPISIKDALIQYLDSKDEIIVARIEDQLAGYISNDLQQWLSK